MEINIQYFASTDKNKEVLETYTELGNGIKNLIERVNDKPGKYRKDFVRITFNQIVIYL